MSLKLMADTYMFFMAYSCIFPVCGFMFLLIDFNIDKSLCLVYGIFSH